MKALHRMVVTGAFGGLTMATLAASGAFGCTPLANIRVSAPGARPAGQDFAPATLKPGEQLDVHFSHFHPTAAGSYSDVRIKWVTPAGAETAMIDLPGPATPEAGVLQTIPATAESSSSPHFFVAEQFDKDGRRTARESVPVVVWAGSVSPPTPPPPPPPAFEPQPPVAPPSPDVSPEPSPAPASDATPPAATPGTQPEVPRGGTTSAPETARVPAAGGAPAASSAAPGAAALVPSPAAEPAAQPGAVLADAQRDGNQAPLAANDLWSGVQRGSSLVDPAPPADGGSNPAGGLLLVAGAAAMFGVAAAAGRRRLVSIRASR